jgi:putative DNA-invertase from lambdoid prophage Rac
VAAARKRQIDIIVIWKLDLFGRSLKQLVLALEELMFHIIGAMAEFERELIRERVKAGLDNARRKGKRLGRKSVPPVDRDRIVALFEKDSSLSVRKIAKRVGMSTGFVGRILQEHRMGNSTAL